MRKFIIMAFIFCMSICLMGCGDGETGGGLLAKNKIDIKDIAWNVDEGIVNGDRYVLLDYTNNTKYPITYFKITFKEKSGLTEEEKNNYYSDVINILDLKEDDEDIERLKSTPIAMHGSTDAVVKPGESISNKKCNYYEGYYYLKNINHFNLTQPDIATIKYIDGENIYTTYYDFASKKYSNESESEVAYQWTEKELGNKIPKVDALVVENNRDDEHMFWFDAYGLSIEEFNSYVEKCVELGYTTEPYSHDGFYKANNAEGYKLRLDYNEDNHSMDCMLEAPEKSE